MQTAWHLEYMGATMATRKKPNECKHERAEPGDICPDCGVEVQDPAEAKLRGIVGSVMEEYGFKKKEAPAPPDPKKKKGLLDRLLE